MTYDIILKHIDLDLNGVPSILHKVYPAENAGTRKNTEWALWSPGRNLVEFVHGTRIFRLDLLTGRLETQRCTSELCEDVEYEFISVIAHGDNRHFKYENWSSEYDGKTKSFISRQWK